MLPPFLFQTSSLRFALSVPAASQRASSNFFLLLIESKRRYFLVVRLSQRTDSRLAIRHFFVRLASPTSPEPWHYRQPVSPIDAPDAGLFA